MLETFDFEAVLTDFCLKELALVLVLLLSLQGSLAGVEVSLEHLGLRRDLNVPCFDITVRHLLFRFQFLDGLPQLSDRGLSVLELLLLLCELFSKREPFLASLFKACLKCLYTLVGLTQLVIFFAKEPVCKHELLHQVLGLT